MDQHTMNSHLVISSAFHSWTVALTLSWDPGSHAAPFVVGELHGGQVVHHRDVDEAVGVLHHAEDGLEVRSPASCTQGRRRTLTKGGRGKKKLETRPSDPVPGSRPRAHRQVDLRRRVVERQLKGRVLVVEGGESAGPRRRHRLTVTQEPVGLEDLPQVCSQAAAVVDHCAQLLHLHASAQPLGSIRYSLYCHFLFYELKWK